MHSGHTPVKRKHDVEQHADDCGESLDSIIPVVDSVGWTSELMGFDSKEEDLESLVQERTFDFVYGQGRWMHGSRSQKRMQRVRNRPVCLLSVLDQILNNDKTSFLTALVEIFGYEHETSFLLCKFHDHRSGQNLDVTCGFRPAVSGDCDQVLQYLQRVRPLVTLITPTSQAQSVSAMGKLCSAIAANQAAAKRYFFAEQSPIVGLFNNPEWKSVAQAHNVYKCILNKKPAMEFQSNCKMLISNLLGQADYVCHQADDFVAEFEVWPSNLCRVFAAGVSDLMLDEMTSQLSYVGCPGCRNHRRKDDPSHTRSGDCKHPNVETFRWTCDACVRNLARASPKHLLDHTCRWAVASTKQPGLSRERKGSHPRDGRVQQSSDPTAELRMADLAPDERPSLPSASSRDPNPHSLPSASSHEPHSHDGETAEVSDETHRVSSRGSGARVSGPRRRDMASQVSEGGAGVRVVRDRGERSVEGGAPPNPGDGGGEGAVRDAPQSDNVEGDEWSRFDIGRALQELRSSKPAVVRRAMRRLHLRWFHAPAARMESLLQAAGVAAGVIAIAKQVVDTCSVCRAWAKPGPRTVTSTALPSRFNQLIQCDLLFIKTHVILHTIDLCTRFTMAEISPSRNTNDLLTALQRSWFRIFGPPRVLTVDQEGGLSGPEAAAWLEARGVRLDLKAKEQHATTVERHHEVLRRQFHLLDTNALNEGLRASFEAILAECVFAKNILFNLGGSTPYECVFGRVPPLITVVSHEAPDFVDDRDSDRLRHLSLRCMLQASAEQKARRAAQTKTRRAGELLELEPGDLVEFYRKASSKDIECWSGPATVVDITSIRDGLISIRWQGRVISCRIQDVRRALTYVTLLSANRHDSPVSVLQNAAESHVGIIIRLGWFQQGGSWRSFEGNQRYPRELLAGLHVAACNLGFMGVVALRFGRAISSLPAAPCDESLLLWWDPNKLEEWRTALLSGAQSINFSRLCETKSPDICFVQFFAESSEVILELRKIAIDVPNIGGIHDPALPAMIDLTQQVQHRERQRLAILDAEPQPETFDIGTPEGGSQNTEEIATESEVDSEPLVSMYACRPPEVCVDAASEIAFVCLSEELLSSPPELEFANPVRTFLAVDKPQRSVGKSLVMLVDGSGQAVIERTHNILTRAEALEHVNECRESMVKELTRWHKHQAWKRGPLREAQNALTSKWVLKWKQVDGKKTVKARLVAQGFKDRQSVQNYASTTTRWGQRILLALSVQFGWRLASADVSEAFLRGLTFKELYEMGVDSTLRQVQLILPPGSEELIRTLPGLEDFSSQNECLFLLKPGFGLKDAPRLWNLALKKVLTRIGLVATKADPQLYIKHRAGRLILIISVHVDDLKITGEESEISAAIRSLETDFDAMKLEYDNFEHLGLKHRLLPSGARAISQQHYVQELRPIADADLKLRKPDEVVEDELKTKFMSLVGGIAWVVQTRPDVAVFVAALQRRLKEPRVQDLLNLNRVLKYVKLRPLELVFHKIPDPWSVVVISDSAFKSEDQDCLAIRSGIIALTSKNGTSLGCNRLQVLEFVTKKQSKVCRSTFAAELHGCLDILVTANVINSALTEILSGAKSADELSKMQDEGTHSLNLDTVIDAKSVWQSATSEELRCNDHLALLHLCKLRELISSNVRHFIWCDTRDMLADGLTKGVIDRQALRKLALEGVWDVTQALEVFVKPKTGHTAEILE